MVSINTSTVISMPVQEVFEYVANFENAPQWQAGVVKSHKATDGKIRVGTRFDEEVRIVAWKAKTVCMITGLDAGKSFTFALTSGPVDCQGTFTFEHTAVGTLVSIRATAEMKGIWKLLTPLFSMDAKGGARKELVRMKKALESRAAPSSSRLKAQA